MKKNNAPSKYQLMILEQLLQRGVVLQSWKCDDWDKEEVYLQKHMIDTAKIRYNTFAALLRNDFITKEDVRKSILGDTHTYSASPLAEKIVKDKYKDQIEKTKIPFHDFMEFSNLMREYLARRNNDEKD